MYQIKFAEKNPLEKSVEKKFIGNIEVIPKIRDVETG